MRSQPWWMWALGLLMLLALGCMAVDFVSGAPPRYPDGMTPWRF